MSEVAIDASIDLGGRWEFGISERRLVGDPSTAGDLRGAGLTLYPAAVPGNLELDLQANGHIEDPFLGMNIVALRRLEDLWVYYVRTFDAEPRPGTTPEVVFEGLDCFADIWLNGQLVHHSDNMLIEQRIPVADALRAGANELCVRIEPAVGRAHTGQYPYPPGLDAEGSGYEGLYVRKAPHMYGWDIMPRAISAGIWRPVRLDFLQQERLQWVWLDTEDLSSDLGEARLALHYQARIATDSAAGYEVRYAGYSAESGFSGCAPLLFEAGCIRFTLSKPHVWWPRGRGRPDLYDVMVELLRDGTVIDTSTLSHGIRTVELDRSSVTTDQGDGRFCFIVNGERLFIMGTNWVPLDAYHSRDAERIRPILDLVEDIGCNMIRCWGGNVYENDRFYDLCDRKGILVWQDFAMACAIYPQDDAFQVRIRDEVTAVIRRLRQHPCLALWAGDNECDQKYIWGGRRRDPNDNVLTRRVIPGVLAQEDPSRPYLPSSPFIDPVAFVAGERYLPEDHLWGPRDYYKSPFYTSALAHFASEIGYHGCPDPTSVRRFLSPDKVWPYRDNEEWLLHGTSPIPGLHVQDYRVELMASQVRVLFGAVPDTLEEFAYASQASQAEAMKFFIEMFRAAKWRRSGIIWWNIADGWPQFSDAVVDYYLVRKRAFDVVKRAQRPLSIVVREPVGRTHELVACNDGRDARRIAYTVRDLDSTRILAEGGATADGDAVTLVASIPADLERQHCLLLEWDDDDGHGRSHYLAGRPPFDLHQYRSWMEQVDA